jgi:hypothetical protein
MTDQRIIERPLPKAMMAENGTKTRFHQLI